MKKKISFIRLPLAALLVAATTANLAEAKPGFGGGASCANCHGGSNDGALSILPSDLFSIQPGETKTITFEFTEIPSGKAALALSGIDDAGLGASFDASWSIVSGALLAPNEPFVEAPAPKSYTLDLTVDAGATQGNYGISGQIAGGAAFSPQSWNNTFDFVISVVPEPASLALLGVGLIGLTHAASRKRKGPWLRP